LLPFIGIQIENTNTKNFKNLMEIRPFSIVVEILAGDVVYIHGITGDDKIGNVCEPRSFELKSATMMFQN
jgi:hypothetical protein